MVSGKRFDVIISTHVPRAGDDVLDSTPKTAAEIFQPTSPVRETTPVLTGFGVSVAISTHVPRAGDDGRWDMWCKCAKYFNPRPPCGRRLLAEARPGLYNLFQPTSPVRETT